MVEEQLRPPEDLGQPEELGQEESVVKEKPVTIGHPIFTELANDLKDSRRPVSKSYDNLSVQQVIDTTIRDLLTTEDVIKAGVKTEVGTPEVDFDGNRCKIKGGARIVAPIPGDIGIEGMLAAAEGGGITWDGEPKIHIDGKIQAALVVVGKWGSVDKKIQSLKKNPGVVIGEVFIEQLKVRGVVGSVIGMTIADNLLIVTFKKEAEGVTEGSVKI